MERSGGVLGEGNLVCLEDSVSEDGVWAAHGGTVSDEPGERGEG